MPLQQFIDQFGYAAVFIGCFLEGETVLVLAGFAAHLGFLSLPGVMATAALAGFLGDEAWFLVGLRYGERILGRFPKLSKARPYVQQKVDRYGHWVVFFIRFAIGLRIAAPIILGATGMRVSHFMSANAAGAIAWALAVGSAGYLFGAAFTGMVEHAKRFEAIAFGVVAVGALMIVLLRGWWTGRLEVRARRRAGADALK